MSIRLTILDRYMPGAHPDRQYRLRQLFGGILSLIFYTVAMVVIVVVGINNQFGNIQFVDKEAERRYRVAWIESGRKLVYPPGFFAPINTKALEQLAAEEKEKAKRKQQREHRRALAEAKKRETEEANNVAKNNEDKKSNGDDVAGNGAADQSQQQKPADPKPPPVAINVAPLRDHIDEAVNRYRKGQLKINVNSLHGTVSVGLDSSGDFGEVKMVSSSGSRDADELAKAFLKELLDQPGVKPFLAGFTMIRISVDATSSDVSIGVVGDTSSTLNAANVVAAVKIAMMLKKGSAAPDSNTALVLNSIKILQNGNQVHATISLPRDTASNVMKGFGLQQPANKS